MSTEVTHTCGGRLRCTPACPAWKTLTAPEQNYYSRVTKGAPPTRGFRGSPIRLPPWVPSKISYSPAGSLDTLLAKIRGAGWSVAVHNDYRQGSERFTFWLFTHENGRYVKGEGRADVEALQKVLEEIG